MLRGGQKISGNFWGEFPLGGQLITIGCYWHYWYTKTSFAQIFEIHIYFFFINPILCPIQIKVT